MKQRKILLTFKRCTSLTFPVNKYTSAYGYNCYHYTKHSIDKIILIIKPHTNFVESHCKYLVKNDPQHNGAINLLYNSLPNGKTKNQELLHFVHNNIWFDTP